MDLARRIGRLEGFDEAMAVTVPQFVVALQDTDGAVTIGHGDDSEVLTAEAWARRRATYSDTEHVVVFTRRHDTRGVSHE